MTSYEYKIVPAPRRAERIRGVKGNGERYATTLTELMNTLARDGWEFQRSETLPVEVRSGFTGRAIENHTMLVFRRESQGGSSDKPLPLFTSSSSQGPRLGPARKSDSES